MASRLTLQETLKEILRSNYVYFQPPESIKLHYPCIIWEEAKGRPFRADDRLYMYRKTYNLIFIDTDPDSVIPDKIRDLPLCDSGSPYKSDNLYHWPFTIYL